MNNTAKKKLCILTLSLIAASILLFACNNVDTDSTYNSDVSESTVDTENDKKIIQLSSNCYNDYGNYSFSGSLLYFFDSENCKRIILCNAPGCLHNSTACNAFISSEASSNDDSPSFVQTSSAVFIFSRNNRIYMLLTDGNIISKNYDGTDFKRHIKFGDKYTYDKAYMIKNKILIYAFYSSQENGEIVEKACFLEYDISKEIYREVIAFNRNLTGDVLIGLSDEKTAVFYHKDEIKEFTAGTSSEDAKAETERTKCTVYTLNFETNTEKNIFAGTLGECSDVSMLNGDLYFYSSQSEIIGTIDTTNGKTSTLHEKVSGEVIFDNTVGDCLVLGRTKGISDKWNPENEVVEFFNTKTNELKEAYKIKSNIDWNNNFRGILAETKDSYIMIYKAEFTVDDSYDIPAVADMIPFIGIINKTDFWNQNYNFKEIDWLI